MALRRPGGRGRLVLFGGSGSQSCPFRSIWRRRAASLQEGAARQNHESVPMASSPPHYEQQYLDLMRYIWLHGDERIDRTGVGTRSILGATMRFSLADDAVPLLTTKRVYWKVAAREMLWFLTGDTNIRELVRQGVHIWTDRSEEHTS